LIPVLACFEDLEPLVPCSGTGKQQEFLALFPGDISVKSGHPMLSGKQSS
jgi:hypothetical protein